MKDKIISGFKSLSPLITIAAIILLASSTYHFREVNEEE